MEVCSLMPAFSSHRFFCMKCGNEGMPLARRHGRLHEKFHRKQLWCYHCKVLINHIECRNDLEIKEFKENFAKGVYKNESKESLSHCGSIRLW